MANKMKPKQKFFWRLFTALFPVFLSGQSFSNSVALAPDEAKVVILDYVEGEVSLRLVSDTDSYLVRHPLGRNGRAIALVESSDSHLVWQIEFDSVEGKSVRYFEVDIGSRPYIAAKYITEAGKMKGKEAIHFYRRAMNMEISEFGLSDYAAFNAAILFARNSSYESALTSLDKIKSNCLFEDNCYRQNWLRGEILFSQDDYTGSLGYLNKALFAANENNNGSNETDIADIKITLGFAEIITGRLDEGKKKLDEALAFAESLQDKELLGKVHNNLGGYYNFTGNLILASKHLTSASNHLLQTERTRELIFALGNLSQNFEYMGEFQLARNAAFQALTFAESTDDPSQQSVVYTKLASIYASLGEYSIAEEFAQKGIEYDIKSDRLWRSYTMVNLLGDTQLHQQKFKDSLSNYTKALNFFRASNNSSYTISTLTRIGKLHNKSGAYSKAIQSFDEATQLYQKLTPASQSSPRSSFFELQVAEAEALLGLGNIEAAKTQLETLFKQCVSKPQPYHVDASIVLLKIYKELNLDEDAIDEGLKAVRYVNNVRSQLDFARLGPAWSAKNYPVYTTAAALLLNQFRKTNYLPVFDLALTILEQGRSIGIQQQRDYSRSLNSRDQAMPNSIFKDLIELANVRTLTDKNENLTEYFRKLEQYLNVLKLNKSSLAPVEVTSKKIQEKLPLNAGFLNYFCVPTENCYGVFIARDQLVVSILGDTSSLFNLAKDFYDLNSIEVQDGSEVPKQLGKKLIFFDLPKIIDHLYIESDPPFDSLPLNALILPEKQGKKESYLIERLTVTRVISLVEAVADAQDSNLTPITLDVAVLADPEFGVADTGIAANNVTFRSRSNGLPSLPWTSVEARHIELEMKGKSVKLMLGSEANRENFLNKETRNSSIMHIATHGFFEASSPDLVGLSLTPSNKAPGFLALEEILQYPFNSDLIVISGCDTGRGQDRGAEGTISLARGFLGQGAKNVISTLWPVSDRASAEFMKYFYQYLNRSDLSFSQALREAQLNMSRHPRYKSPFYWAPYTISSISP